MPHKTHVEAAVVGGGPAGLAGALYLARFRRNVVVVDEGDSRAARIPRSHNVAGFEHGIRGADLIGIMRRQAEAVGVRFLRGRVEGLDRDDAGFALRLADGAMELAGTVLLACGAADVEPPMPAVGLAVERGALRYCPVCDGYEAAGLEVGVLCDSAAGLHEAYYLRHFTPRLRVFCTRAGIEVGEDDQRRLGALGIAFDPAPATDIRLAGGRVAVVHGGRTSFCDSLYSALGMRVHSGLAAALGAELDDDGYVVTDRHHRTTVDGLYAAGDMAKGLNQISVGIGGAALAASAMHLRLLDGAR